MTAQLTSGGIGSIDEGAIAAFRASLGGPLLAAGDAGYEEARHTFNAMIDRRPGLIARCTATGDVVKAVRFARQHDLVMSVRGGGHNVAGNAVCEGGLMIDLTLMKGIRVDPAARTVRAQAGLTWREFDRETQTHGLATTGGAVSSTGIAGLTLGGGFGWLGRGYGLACDNLLSADVVLADGMLVTASQDSNPDLFWALKGGGGNFGIVTSFEYQLYPVGPILGGMLVYPFERAKEILTAYRDFNATAPDAMTAFAALMTSPEGAKVVALIVCYNGDPAQGEALLKPLREGSAPLADLVGPMAYEQQQTLLDEGFPFGLQNYWKSEFLKALSDEAIDAIVAQVAAVPSPLSAVVLEQFGGAYRRVGPEETAFSHRDWDYNLLIISRWTDVAESEQHIQWARDVWQAMQPFASGGVYVNYLEPGQDGTARIRAAYGPNYARLAAVKRQYDPTNVFQLNQNIPPA
ncbi:MAG: FAD-binding oxidoreductase [Chloroflexi bacterium]|nr:FAD-binding oxidoreductase [Chloroflexota bacterium]